jgi:hypothetical protein
VTTSLNESIQTQFRTIAWSSIHPKYGVAWRVSRYLYPAAVAV